jgi:NADPH-dependent ferric siderophore reductase
VTVDLDSPAYSARVIRTRHVSAHMVRVTVNDIRAEHGGPPPAPGGPGDEFFGLWIPTPDGRPVKRYYTARAWRPETGELDVDLLLHGHGPATEWAARAAVGDVVGFDEPRGHYRPPADTEWIVLSGDATALPAIGRILEERDATAPPVPVTVVIALDDAADRQQLPVSSIDTLIWVRPDELVSRTRALVQTPGTGYVWFSGEASDMRAVRALLRRELRWPTSRWMTMGYWRRDSEAWDARYRAAGAQLHERLAEVFASEQDEQLQLDHAEELLRAEGLL